MRRAITVLTFVAVALYAVPAIVAQQGHGAGMGTHGMGHNAGTQAGHAAHAKSIAKTPSDQLATKPKLTSKLQSLLPSTMTPQQACEGFKNLGQCVSAIHVSHNLNIPFTDLKDKMLGNSSTDPQAKPMSLGKAIQTLAPKADATTETQKATQQANEDLKQKA
jgi:hypothetical protein